MKSRLFFDPRRNHRLLCGLNVRFKKTSLSLSASGSGRWLSCLRTVGPRNGKHRRIDCGCYRCHHEEAKRSESETQNKYCSHVLGFWESRLLCHAGFSTHGKLVQTCLPKKKHARPNTSHVSPTENLGHFPRGTRPSNTEITFLERSPLRGQVRLLLFCSESEAGGLGTQESADDQEAARAWPRLAGHWVAQNGAAALLRPRYRGA